MHQLCHHKQQPLLVCFHLNSFVFHFYFRIDPIANKKTLFSWFTCWIKVFKLTVLTLKSCCMERSRAIYKTVFSPFFNRSVSSRISEEYGSSNSRAVNSITESGVFIWCTHKSINTKCSSCFLA